MQLLRLPSGEVSTDFNNAVRAVYQITTTQNDTQDAYTVTQKDPGEGMTNKLSCINYSECYYQNDNDYKEGLL